ncbi:MAG TPA: hypothetical protein VF540_13550 [Segetibacter sp.]
MKKLVLAIFAVVLIAAGCETQVSQNTQPTQQEENKTENTQPTPEPTPTPENIKVVVSSQVIKKVDNKYRYFFDIRNNDTKDFSGDVKIQMFNEKGTLLGSNTFSTKQPISPNLGNSVYIDANTAPLDIHTELGITKFKYEIKTDGKVVGSGDGVVPKGITE